MSSKFGTLAQVPQTWRCWEFTSVFAKHSRSFSLIDSLAVGVDRTRRNFGPMQKKGSMRKKGTKLLQILINASLEMSASSFNRRPAFLCGEGLTLASLAPYALGASKYV